MPDSLRRVWSRSGGHGQRHRPVREIIAGHVAQYVATTTLCLTNDRTMKATSTEKLSTTQACDAEPGGDIRWCLIPEVANVCVSDFPR